LRSANGYRDGPAFVNALCAGILAGQEIVIHYGLHRPAQILDERSQLILRKALVHAIRVLVPAFSA
jgi:hypothetical protein